MFDTLLDEQSILGLALGAGLAGLLPVPEIQYLAYLHNAADQLRGEAATLSFFSRAQYRNPMVVRIAGLAYQKGFGGHFHNDNAVAALRDIPGLVIAVPGPARGRRRRCCAPAWPRPRSTAACACSSSRSPCTTSVTCTSRATAAGWPRTSRRGGGPPRTSRRAGPACTATGDDLTIVTFGNGLRMSLRVAARLQAEGIGCRVLDLRWLAPLPVEDLLREATMTGRVLVADETRRTGGVSEGVIAALADAGFTGRVAAGDQRRTASSRWATRRPPCCCPSRPSRPPRGPAG